MKNFWNRSLHLVVVFSFCFGIAQAASQNYTLAILYFITTFLTSMLIIPWGKEKIQKPDLPQKITTFAEFQSFTDLTAQYPDENFEGTIYCAMGLAGEAGECLEKVKKAWRNDNGVLTDAKRESIAHEIGDTMWYQAQLAKKIGYSLEEIASMNVKKLRDRLERDVVKSVGDSR